MREGMPEANARSQAVREFGDVAAGVQVCLAHGATIERQRWFARVVSDIRQDLAYGCRIIGRSPGFLTVAVLTLAVAIGGNTTIFSVTNALFFKPLPYANPDTLARVYSGENQIAWMNFRDVRARSRSFADIAAHRSTMATLWLGDTPVRLGGQTVTSNFFTVLGVPAALGRTFLPADDRTDIVVLSDREWRRQFAADPSIVGRPIVLDNRTYEVVGVMPPLFRGVGPPGFMRGYWIPVDAVDQDRRSRDRTSSQWEAIGRLASGVSHDQATAELRVIAHGIRAEHTEIPQVFERAQALSVGGLEAFRGVAKTLLPVFAFLALMSTIAGIVLLIGCANIAGLLLGRAAARRREIAVRLALGASRQRLVRQLLTESALLALIGGVAGILLAAWLTGAIDALISRLPLPIQFDLTLDWRVLAYALMLSMGTALVFGLAPARRASRIDLVPSLKDDSGEVRRQRMRQALVIGQVALCSILLAWAGLFARSLRNAVNVDPGFDPSNVVIANIELGEVPDKAVKTQAVIADLQQRIEQMPGVESAGSSTVIPLALMGREEFRVSLLNDPANTRPWVVANRVTPGWFRTLRIPLVAGRDFTWNDRAGSPEVAIVNETLARLLGESASPIGMQLKAPAVEIVGVVGDTKYWTIGETIKPTIFLPFSQSIGGGQPNLHVRTTAPVAVGKAIRAELSRIAPGLAPEITAMPDAVGVATMPARAGAIFTAAFGAIAAALATLGIYGLVAFSVVQRRKEIGVRKAIGASTVQIVRLVVAQTTATVSIGLFLGLAVAIAGGRILQALIVQVSPADPLTIAGDAFLVVSAAVVASAIPALRASRVDPLAVLREL